MDSIFLNKIEKLLMSHHPAAEFCLELFQTLMRFHRVVLFIPERIVRVRQIIPEVPVYRVLDLDGG